MAVKFNAEEECDVCRGVFDLYKHDECPGCFWPSPRAIRMNEPDAKEYDE